MKPHFVRKNFHDIKVVIVGYPKAGKSSLKNNLYQVTKNDFEI